MKNFAVCLQMDPESYEWGLSARSIAVMYSENPIHSEKWQRERYALF